MNIFNELKDMMYQSVHNLISKEIFKDWLKDNIVIKKYIPIEEKFGLINLLKMDFNLEYLTFDNVKGTFEEEYIIMEYEKYFLFDLVLQYTNINIHNNDKTYENYDLILESGFYDYIKEFVGADLMRLKKSASQVINISNILLLKKAENILLDIPSLEDAKNIKDTINDIDINKLDYLQKIEAFNNPVMNNLVTKMKK